MGDFWVDMALAIVFSVLKQVVKNPGRKEALKKAFLKLRNTINAAYAGDSDFEG
ncbi:MAG: hypothetical protein ACRD2K_03820 [Terriglobales bacterium]